MDIISQLLSEVQKYSQSLSSRENVYNLGEKNPPKPFSLAK